MHYLWLFICHLKLSVSIKNNVWVFIIITTLLLHCYSYPWSYWHSSSANQVREWLDNCFIFSCNATCFAMKQSVTIFCLCCCCFWNDAVASALKGELLTVWHWLHNAIWKHVLLASGGLEWQTCIWEFILACKWIRKERWKNNVGLHNVCVAVRMWLCVCTQESGLNRIHNKQWKLYWLTNCTWNHRKRQNSSVTVRSGIV